MSISNDLIQAARAWIMLATGYANARVIPSDDDGPRPMKPYIVVDVPTKGLKVGTDEVVMALNGAQLEERVMGHRRGIIRITGYGPDVDDAIETADLKLWSQPIIALNKTNKISLTSLGELQDLTRYLESKAEDVWQKDFNVSYAIIQTAGGAEAIASFETLELTMTFVSEVADSDRTVTITSPS